ncbi:hypothetical protein AK812_SmicGene38539 [Symbiodinium microadriaticum]|uniref:Uncharacterized protein n=1 Tax=Symbiodinium microadriaticum TaxID=2951 RepID=A0A1Q9CDI9_SYMMI|nr:hypothetical protein AK812_SmicGene38539 [Symbiodinium microadriaticum]
MAMRCVRRKRGNSAECADCAANALDAPIALDRAECADLPWSRRIAPIALTCAGWGLNFMINRKTEHRDQPESFREGSAWYRDVPRCSEPARAQSEHAQFMAGKQTRLDYPAVLASDQQMAYSPSSDCADAGLSDFFMRIRHARPGLAAWYKLAAGRELAAGYQFDRNAPNLAQYRRKRVRREEPLELELGEGSQTKRDWKSLVRSHDVCLLFKLSLKANSNLVAGYGSVAEFEVHHKGAGGNILGPDPSTAGHETYLCAYAKLLREIRNMEAGLTRSAVDALAFSERLRQDAVNKKQVQLACELHSECRAPDNVTACAGQDAAFLRATLGQSAVCHRKYLAVP